MDRASIKGSPGAFERKPRVLTAALHGISCIRVGGDVNGACDLLSNLIILALDGRVSMTECVLRKSSCAGSVRMVRSLGTFMTADHDPSTRTESGIDGSLREAVE